ncbi:single-stranded-DNA-specific exonuclease RecJ [Mechercharimyces sp. CAU 1602]|uniref:single-stranded-DNA-specific exonuclease RecJ n=1 Tax=Mechercharimyces sp. CAU 1602 TaxID=2973933 RepID=UPI0021617D92|nr:single-stranded-DNA-specific exonuclease RecJ [Mechercharimyces sp. CAU 1602]MCS1350687.1 single-stranded-DNA-specific exonuclease RecJ [Mechercharimyces sp. CAU 1602]
MLQAKTRWQLATVEQSKVERLTAELHVKPLVASLLLSRGIEDPVEAKRFLHVHPEQLHDPFLLDGMKEAVARIQQAIAAAEPIVIYGDYDADGVSSTSLMMKVFQRLHANVDYYIPNRFSEGYGLNKQALEKIQANGAHLVITVDTGISAIEEAELCKELGIDLIVTDHHEPPEVLPAAYSVINPKKPNCTYPFDGLAGVGVAFKLAQALLGEMPEEVLEFVALGTIADLVPLLDENRVLAALGLQKMNQRRMTGLTALFDVAGVSDPITAEDVGFSIGPRINASGRLDSANKAVNLLLAEDHEEARVLAEELDHLNRTRQKMVETIAIEAVAQVDQNREAHEHVIVVAGQGWNVGVIGIVASRLVEKYYRPAIVLGIDLETNEAKGSARSIAGFDMYRALSRCKEWMTKFGGHPMAAGMSLPADHITSLHQNLSEIAMQELSAEDYIPLSRVDADITLDQIDLSLLEQLGALAPFGVANPTPSIRISGVTVERKQRLGQQKNHLKLRIKSEENHLDVIGFRMAGLADQMSSSASLQLLGELTINEWNGRRTPQLLLRDLAIPHVQLFDWRGNTSLMDKLEKVTHLPDVAVIAPEQQRDKCGQASMMTWEEWNERHVLKPLSFKHWVLADIPPSLNEFNQWLQTLDHQVERIYFIYGDTEWEGEWYSLDREKFKRLYGYLLQKRSVLAKRDLAGLARQVGLSEQMVRYMIGVFKELEFIVETAGRIDVVQQPAKKELAESSLFRRREEQVEVVSALIYSSYKDLYAYIQEQTRIQIDLGGDRNGLQRQNSRSEGLSTTGSSI